MKKILLIFCFLLFTGKIFAQQFSQYNTNTLFDSFENPSQKSFITDSSKRFASNFLIPSLSGNIVMTGNAQATLKSRFILDKYNNSLLQIDQGKYSHISTSDNYYLFMLKMFSSLGGDSEWGISSQVRSEGKGLFSDESAALFNGTKSFANDNYTNIFNDNYYLQVYNQLSVTYRENITSQFALGIKVSALLGVKYENMNIQSSKIAFDKVADTANVAIKGQFRGSYIPGNFNARDFLPTFRNPGASVSIGGSYRTEDNFFLQVNIKDLGFIHWSSRSKVYNFDNNHEIGGLSSRSREDSIYNKVDDLLHHNPTVEGFTTMIDGMAEVSVSQRYWLDYDQKLKYSPTLIASKELFYPGFTAAFVNPIQYKQYVFTLTTTYNDLKVFTAGGQFMIKTPNAEFYIGSDRIYQSLSLLYDAVHNSAQDINQNHPVLAADFFMGVTFKFGPLIEHPMNASYIPNGEKGFLGRLWGRLFKTYD